MDELTAIVHRSYPAKWGGRRTFTLGRDEAEYDEAVIREVFVEDTYNVADITEAPSTVFDIGAHIGTFTVAIKTRFPDARVVAIEPHPRNVALLKENVKDFENVTVIQGAVGYRKGSLLAVGRNATGGSILVTPEEYAKWEPGRYDLLDEPICVYTIEELFALSGFDEVDLTKWDCEGGEIDCFDNMGMGTAQRFNDMVGEFHLSGAYTVSEGYEAFEGLAGWTFPHHEFFRRQNDDSNPGCMGWFQARRRK